MPAVEALLEMEKRGILPEDKKPILAEMRKRGMAPGTSWKQVGKGARKAAPGSFVETGKALVTPFIHPIETAKGVAKLGAGTLNILGEKMGLPPERLPITHEGRGYQEYPRAFYREIANKYFGGEEAFKQALMKDPFGVIADITTILPGGAITKLGKVSKLAPIEKAGKLMQAPEKIVKAPISLPVETAKVMLPSKLPERLYESVVKPSTTLSPVKRGKILKTGLEEKIAPTEKGLLKLGGIQRDLRQKVEGLISEGEKGGDVIQTSDILKRLDDVKNKAIKTDTPLEDLGMVYKTEEAFKIHGDIIPLEKAQEIKKAIYKKLDDADYARKLGKSVPTFKTEGRKAIARGIKEELESRYPELKSLNKRDSDLINLQKSIERATGRLENKDVIGIGTPIAAMGAEAVTGEGKIGVIAGIIRHILANPHINAPIAFALNRARKKAESIKGITRKLPKAPPSFVYQAGKAGEREQFMSPNEGEK